jgi:hypothetical protein
MNPKMKLVLALQQVDSLTSLLQGNEYQQFLYGHLIQIQVELKRQLTLLQASANIEQ